MKGSWRLRNRSTGHQHSSNTDDSTTSLIINSVRLEVKVFEAAARMPMYQTTEKTEENGNRDGKGDNSDNDSDNSEGVKLYLNPLDVWRVRTAEFPHLASRARRVLAVRATQVESERLFSCAGNTVTKTRNTFAPTTVELLVPLHHSWGIVEKWEASKKSS